MTTTPSAWSRDIAGLSPRRALRLAWRIWIFLLTIPLFIFFFNAAYFMAVLTEGDAALGDKLFIASLIWIGVAVPLAFGIRGQIFEAYWHGGVVPPKQYLVGMCFVWIAIELGGIISLLGCTFSGNFLPGMMPGAVAFVLFLTLWPTGESMVNAVGTQDDPAVHMDPR